MAGIFAVGSKPAKAQGKPQTTLRFNENRIEAWTGKKWVNVITVDVLDVVFPWDEPGGLLITVSEPGLTHVTQHDNAEGLTFHSPTAEQRRKLNNDVGEIKEFKCEDSNIADDVSLDYDIKPY